MTEKTDLPMPLLLDCHEAAALLGVSLRLFRDLTKRPGFPAARALTSRNNRWHRGELEAYAASLPAARRDEPAPLLEARRARQAGKAAAPSAHAPFPDPAPQPTKRWERAPSWREGS